ncbi:hypothetical protein E6Q11_00385 [Candidatus Dojkabacteria bacterium]|uniref:Uncharacterized protein n=1 Tax=Candidatus Dojkabacteria bacterium TaxID=2099670 RepID=A0A5C7JB07_9BACT|nr:MAG: hypothetical protein E6Q11_00385 [Candidatus Dojkabacteria bacterium]
MANVPHPVMGIDDMGNHQMMMPGQEYMFPGSQVLEIPMKSFQSGGFTAGEPVGRPNAIIPDFSKILKDVARDQVKSFGTNSQAPQNMTTDNMIEYKNKSFANKIAQNNFKAMAMQEADAMANMMNQAFMPMAQFGMNVQSYDANHSNAGAYFDAYNTLKNQSQEDFNNFLGESGEMVQSIYNNPAQMKLAKVRTRITDPTIKDQYKQYKKSMKTGMTLDESMDPWDAYNQKIQTMKDKNQPISMTDMGEIPMNFGYMPQMVYMVGGPIPKFQYGTGQTNLNPGERVFPNWNIPIAHRVGNVGWDQFGNQVFINSPTQGDNNSQKSAKNPRLNNNDDYQYYFNREPEIVPGLHTSDPQGGIGQSMYSSGFHDVYDQFGRQFWVQRPTQVYLDALDKQQNTQSTTPNPVVPKKGAGTKPVVPKKGNTTGSESTEEIKEFTHDDVSASDNSGSTTAVTERRGNVTDEPTGSTSSTTGTTVGTQQGDGFFVTQPGYYGQQGMGYNIFPSNMRWQRGPGMNVGPAVAYNPMDTYLDEYDYKGRLFGKGPRRVKMTFSHYGKPGFPQVDEVNENESFTNDHAPIGTIYKPSSQNTHPAYNSVNNNTRETPLNSTHGQMQFIEDLNQKLPLNSKTLQGISNLKFAEGGGVDEPPLNPYYKQQWAIYNKWNNPSNFIEKTTSVLEGPQLDTWYKKTVENNPDALISGDFIGNYKPTKVYINETGNAYYPVYDKPSKELISAPFKDSYLKKADDASKSGHINYVKGSLRKADTPHAIASFSMPYASPEEKLQIEADFKNIKTDVDYKNSPYHQRYGDNIYKAHTNYVPELRHGGFPFSTQPSYPGANPFESQLLFFKGGGLNKIGLPNSEPDPWAKTEAVWKRQMAGNSQDWADWGLAGMSMLSSIAENDERQAMEEQMKQRMVGDAVFNPYGAGDASRGTWSVNHGDFRPDQHTPVQFQGWNQGMIGSPMTQGKYGGQYQNGGEYYLSDDEINQIMAMGGQVEFLD